MPRWRWNRFARTSGVYMVTVNKLNDDDCFHKSFLARTHVECNILRTTHAIFSLAKTQYNFQNLESGQPSDHPRRPRGS